MAATGANRTSAQVVVVTSVEVARSASVEIDDLVSMFEATDDDRAEMSQARKWVGANTAEKGTLKSLRLAAGLSQAALATAINMSQPNVSAFEAGGRMPSRETVKKLAGALGVSIEYIYTAIEGRQESAHV